MKTFTRFGPSVLNKNVVFNNDDDEIGKDDDFGEKLNPGNLFLKVLIVLIVFVLSRKGILKTRLLFPREYTKSWGHFR